MSFFLQLGDQYKKYNLPKKWGRMTTMITMTTMTTMTKMATMTTMITLTSITTMTICLIFEGFPALLALRVSPE